MNSPNAVNEAIAKAGGMTALAKLMGFKNHGAVYQWKKNQVPAEHCPTIERLTGVRCEDLRPDVEWGVVRGNPSQQKGVSNA